MPPTASHIVAILPCNDLDAAQRWWGELGFTCPQPQNWGRYRILSDDHGAQVHLQQAEAGWLVPGRNPFGVYFYTERVDALFAAVRGSIGKDAAPPEHRSWGMYEFALEGPDGLLVRIGRPSERINPDP